MTRRQAARCAALAAGGLVVVALGGCGSTDPVIGATVTSAVTATGTTTGTPRATADPMSTARPGNGTASGSGPPLVATATWVRGPGGRSLHVVPTVAGRVAQGADDAAQAWREVLRLEPDADRPGMRPQFDCHWAHVRLGQPGMPSWNIEPWRPVVSQQQMVDAWCNPGGPESADGRGPAQDAKTTRLSW